MEPIRHKRGDTFILSSCQLLDDNQNPIDLTDYVIRSQLRTKSGKLVDTLLVEIAADHLSYTMTAQQPESWPAEKLECDVEYTNPDGVRFSSQTFYVDVMRDVTR
ncbi:hypothetical protein [Chrysiogenes arsenatis]|uniref:hypothetical protein n=1 Tax=Chrysiogenes arsenatis TaxID=309797 RepID=UPI000486DD5F|nr:hypothetical protein [Chrysiogenes arsenatis]